MIFSETQKFAPWVTWLIAGIVLVMVLACALVFMSLDLTPLLKTIILIGIVISTLPIFLIKLLRLKTEFDTQEIRMNFSPLSKKVFKWSDIESAKLIDYGFVGGWGIRMMTKYGTVYNTQGSEGLLLKFKNGKSVVIGTQRSEDLQRFLDKNFETFKN